MFKIFAKNELAADVFIRMTEKICGFRPERTNDCRIDFDLVILGNGDDDPFISDLILEGKLELPNFRVGGDDYFVLSRQLGERKLLFIGGGRVRALFYAVYDYFERIGCSYFWDGDILPELSELPLTGFDIQESPRFEYRGLRYFAHRSLHRFQAEHWTLEEWQNEIDWILKKRLNLFMLRIGQDDLFQRAFPDIVPYPEDNVPCPAGLDRSYNDRTHFWKLEERSVLRKALLQYAFDRDLLHPEDTGTMSHWYSRTPEEFLQVEKPEFVVQSSRSYSEPGGLVWDIRQDRHLENYFKLTQAHIDHYGRGEIFHTIGLAERSISSDPQVNHRWKMYAYRRIQERLRKSYPEAKLLIASWDFFHKRWSSEAMKELLESFDPQRTLLFDYTSDTDSKNENFTRWHCVGKFPWIFGIFQAFESGNDLRGNYPVIKERLEIAKNDPWCKGMVIWPENSHSDVLMYEFFAANAWKPECTDIRDFIPGFCRKRYGADAELMERIWFKFLPVIECGHWKNSLFAGEMFGRFAEARFPLADERVPYAAIEAARLKTGIAGAADALERLAELPLTDPVIRRDVIDLARSAGGRLACYLYDAMPGWYNDREKTGEALESLRKILHLLAAVVRSSPEFSLAYSLDRLKAYRPVNPIFEHTLKGNAENSYCRSYIAELFDGCYLAEFELYASHALGAEFDEEAARAIRERFYETPLEQLRPDCDAWLAKLPQTIRQMADCARQLPPACV